MELETHTCKSLCTQALRTKIVDILFELHDDGAYFLRDEFRVPLKSTGYGVTDDKETKLANASKVYLLVSPKLVVDFCVLNHIDPQIGAVSEKLAISENLIQIKSSQKQAIDTCAEASNYLSRVLDNLATIPQLGDFAVWFKNLPLETRRPSHLNQVGNGIVNNRFNRTPFI